MATPQQGVAYTFRVTLADVANGGRIKISPTIAAGDFTVSTDGSAPTNVTTVPAESPVGSGFVLVTLSAAEMGQGGPSTGSKIAVKWSDPEFEWSDASYTFDAPVVNIETVLRTALTEGYAADGVAPTMEQLVFMLWSVLSQFAVVGANINCFGLDGTTQEMQFTMDSAVNPSTRARNS